MGEVRGYLVLDGLIAACGREVLWHTDEVR